MLEVRFTLYFVNDYITAPLSTLRLRTYALPFLSFFRFLVPFWFRHVDPMRRHVSRQFIQSGAARRPALALDDFSPVQVVILLEWVRRTRV